MKWSYGVTTVPSRFTTTLPRTLASLKTAGFERPRLFIDQANEHTELDVDHVALLPRTLHRPGVGAYGNWILAAWELYLREPTAERYAIFQDDMVTYHNLRQYLESCVYPDRGYLNLYTFNRNVKSMQGWYLSDQMGKGAVALVFSNLALRTLLQQQHIIDKPLDCHRGDKSIDGAVVNAMKGVNWREFVHNPSLVQHIGDKSSLGNGPHAPANTFKGEDFNAMELLNNIIKKQPAKPRKHRQRIGLVGYNCRSGLGELNRQLAQYADIDRWLVFPHVKYPTLPPHLEVDTVVCRMGDTAKLEEFVKSVDVVLFCETPYYPNLTNICKRHQRRMVCVPMIEWTPKGAWTRDVDLFLCPTKQCWDQLRQELPSIYFPWPVDVSRFHHRQRSVCRQFLYIHGHGGWKDGKGGPVVRRALQLWPEMPLIIVSQAAPERYLWPNGPNVKVIGELEDNTDLYKLGDVLLCPHSVDGLGLEPMEAMASGMPIVATDGEPWNELPAAALIPARKASMRIKRNMVWYEPDAAAMVSVCKELLNESIESQSVSARQWAEQRDWAAKHSAFDQLVRGGTPSNKPGNDPRQRWNRFLFAEAMQQHNHVTLCTTPADAGVANGSSLIVEIGAIRDRNPLAKQADGYSTLHWAASGYRVHCVDSNPKSIEITRGLVNGNGGNNVRYHCQDGLEFLRSFTEPITLLYLDGPDPDEYGRKFTLDCLRAAPLAPCCVVLIDDCDLANNGKGQYAIPEAQRMGFELVKLDRQALLVRNPA